MKRMKVKLSLLILSVLVLVGVTAYANEQTPKSLYGYVMDLYTDEYVDVYNSKEQILRLSETYNELMRKNMEIESFKASKKYLEDLEAELNISIDNKVDKFKDEQKDIEDTLKNELTTLSTKELSRLTREYSKAQEDINKLLEKKTDLRKASYYYKNKEVSNKKLLAKIEETEKRIKDKRFDPLGSVEELRLPFDYSKIVTSNAGYRTDPINGQLRYHNATDYALPTGTPLYSLFNGKVIESKVNGGYGQSIKVESANGIIVHYAHLDERKVKKGDKVKQNELIGLSGNTGRSTGPHLHLGLYFNDNMLDVEELFIKRGL